MVAPTFKKATDTNPGTSAMYGAPDIKYAFDVLDGSHATDRLQGSVIEHNNHSYDIIVYRTAANVTYARKGSDGSIVTSSGSSPESVIQAAINEGPGNIFISSGTYDFTPTFTGLTIDQSFTTIEMAPDAVLRVPTGYAGAIFLLNTTRNDPDGYIEGATSTLLTANSKTYQGVLLTGGVLDDQDAATSAIRNWTGIRIYASSNNTFANTIRNVKISHCSTGIELLVDDATGDDLGDVKATQSMEYNRFKDITISDFVIGIEFKVHANVTPTTGVGGFHRNTFDNIILEPGNGVSPQVTPTHGFKDVRHDLNTFYNCHCDNLGGSTISANIASTSRQTMIFGGSMNILNYTDLGENTKLIPLATSADILQANYIAETYGGSDYPSLIGKRGLGTSGSPSAITAGETLLEVTGRGHDGVTMSADRAWLKMHANSTWTDTSHPTYIDFGLTSIGSVAPWSRFRIHQNSNIGMVAAAKLSLDGVGATGDTYIWESSANVFQVVAGGTTIYEARSTHALDRGFSGIADPTTTDIPASYFVVAKNTTTGAIKLFYNDVGTLKSVGVSDTAETLTNKTIAFASNTLTDVVSTNTTQTITAAKTFGQSGLRILDSATGTRWYTIQAQGITDFRTLNLPLLTATDTLVAAATTATLTNKTIAFASNTLTDVMSTNTAQTVSGNKSFQNNILRVRNPLDTQSYIFAGSAITTTDKTVTLPLLTSDDTFVFEGHAQTLTNKTLTSPTIATIINTGTLTLPTATTTLVGRDTTETLTNKTLTTPTIAQVKPDATNTVTLPTATDTLVGRATTDTLTNKTIVYGTNTLTDVASTNTAQNITGAKTFTSNNLRVRNSGDTADYLIVGGSTAANRQVTLPDLGAADKFVTENAAQTLTTKTIDAASNTLDNVMAYPSVRRVGGWLGGAVDNGFGWTSGPSFVTLGTITRNAESVGRTVRFTTGTTANSQAGQRGNVDTILVRDMQPDIKWKIRLPNVGSSQFYVGLKAGNSWPSLGASSDPFPSTEGYAIGYQSGASVYQVIRNNGGASSTVTTLTPSTTPTNNNIHVFAIRSTGANFEASIDGNAYVTHTSTLPGATTLLYPFIIIETDNTVEKNIDLFWWFGHTTL